MIRKLIFGSVASFALCVGLQAQDIYKVETFSGSDLNGTARFVGMGGAMSALGADISVMGQNPAGIGLYRRSDVAVTASVTNQPNGKSFGEIDKARTSFDQAGFVYACKLGESGFKYINFGFNYQKRRNLKNYIGLNDIATSNGLSQSWQMLNLAYYGSSLLDLSTTSGRNYTTPLACLGYDTQMIYPEYDDDGNLTGYTPSYADSYNYKRAQWGGVQQFDFNLSLNWEDRIYGGITFGVYNVNMHTATYYAENLIEYGDDGNATGTTYPYYMTNSEKVTGTGYDLKFGLIVRPIEDSPFRIGFSFSTPTFYDLRQSSYLYMNSPYVYTDDVGNTYQNTEADVYVSGFDYRIYTPWKVNISLGTTVGNYLAIDAEYEVSKYTGAQVRYPDYDGWGYESLSSSKDYALAEEIDYFLKPVSTFRIGAEVRLAKNWLGRVGYNFVSAPFEKDAYLNLFTDSPSYYYSTNTDYVNLSEIHRATFGLGFRDTHFYADFAYQYQHQTGDVYAFNVPYSGTEINRLHRQKVNLNRNNFMLTLGYKF